MWQVRNRRRKWYCWVGGDRGGGKGGSRWFVDHFGHGFDNVVGGGGVVVVVGNGMLARHY